MKTIIGAACLLVVLIAVFQVEEISAADGLGFQTLMNSRDTCVGACNSPGTNDEQECTSKCSNAELRCCRKSDGHCRCCASAGSVAPSCCESTGWAPC